MLRELEAGGGTPREPAAEDRSPFGGVGKPEPLRHALAGYWSRRVTDEHRLVYKVTGDAVLIAQVRYHN